ncbi:dead deah box helicase protein [Diplodia corticola]|uniref:Dead deah box helicase protein n=1 Tax=Diplodia corticola TaxID=236234 RepID=A0A1J9S2M4_9PEZI|nr:dead deah box helicase protein [Diplodia corticola]OJD33893.1 dead deah box helicase protein [Diplodia corticola]
MDFVKNLTGGGSSEEKSKQSAEHSSSGSSGGGFMDKMNSMAGGGKESEKNEDLLDKGVDFVQEKFLGAGPQDNESAVEQAKDEQISDFIRAKYKSTTGSDFPIKDKEKKYGA